ANAHGTDPIQSHLTRPSWTVPRRRWTNEPTGFMMAAATRSLDTADSGVMPKNSTNTGVMRAPPPMPVRPTTMPIPRAVTASVQFNGPSASLARNPHGGQGSLGKPYRKDTKPRVRRYRTCASGDQYPTRPYFAGLLRPGTGCSARLGVAAR